MYIYIYIYIIVFLNTINFQCLETLYRAQNTSEDLHIALSKSILQLSIQDLMCVPPKTPTPMGNC